MSFTSPAPAYSRAENGYHFRQYFCDKTNKDNRAELVIPFMLCWHDMLSVIHISGHIMRYLGSEIQLYKFGKCLGIVDLSLNLNLKV